MSPVRIYGDQGYLELAGPTQAGNTSLIMPSGTGTSGQYLQTNGAGVTSWQTVTDTATSVAVLVDQKNGTNGGSATAGSWQTRDLNTEVSDPGGIVTLSSNQFTLGAGTYLIHFTAPAYAVNGHQTRLYDVTNTAVVEYGTSEYAASADFAANSSMGAVGVTITANTTYRIEHRVSTSKTSNGFGVAAAFGTDTDRYARVIIHKLS